MDQSASLLGYLASVSLRSLVLFTVAGVALAALQVRAAAARHAIWTVVAGGMLLLAILTPALPPVALPVLKTAATEVAQLPNAPAAEFHGSAAPLSATPPAAPHFGWEDAAVGLYAIVTLLLLARLAFGYLFTRRLVRAAVPSRRFSDTYTSAWISVPMTIGHKILLPVGWETWDGAKLEAVLAHERTHVLRRDWAIALLAGVNRCVFWFHPLTWWLERQLAALAEHACDDSALLLVPSEPYAQALLEMAASVRSTQGRLLWEAMAMAKAAEVRKRIERILDETREIPTALTRPRWAALLACSIPLIWVASVAQLVPAAAQDAPKTPAAMSEFLRGHRQVTASDANVMEQYLATNPQDIDVRAQLILYYYSVGMREPRMTHILWLVANHPESSAAAFASSGVLPRDSSMNTVADYQRVAASWKDAAAGNRNNPIVVGNAAQFFQDTGDLETAESLLKSDPAGNLARLGRLYALAILEGSGDAKFPMSKPEFSSRVRAQMASSQEGNLMFATGQALVQVARRPAPGQTLPPGVLNLNDHPLLQPAIDLGQQLIERAEQFGGPRVFRFADAPAGGGRGGAIGGVPGGVAGGVPGGVIGGIIGAAPNNVPQTQAAPAPTEPAPPIVKKVDPVYPPLARQARISGVVKLAAIIAADGTIKNLSIISGHPLLVPPTLEAVKQWVFQSTGAEVRTALEVPFVLPPGDAGPVPPGYPAKSMTIEPQPAAPSKIRIGGNVQASKLINKVDPIYPPSARAEGIEGDVSLAVTIAEDGHVEAVEPLQGNPVLAAAAVDAVRQWRYQPTLLNGNPVTVVTSVTVPFQLH